MSHRPKLETHEGTAAQTDPLLFEQDGACGGKPDDYRNDCHYGKQRGRSENEAPEIQGPLPSRESVVRAVGHVVIRRAVFTMCVEVNLYHFYDSHFGVNPHVLRHAPDADCEAFEVLAVAIGSSQFSGACACHGTDHRSYPYSG
jgi:hypothetical protein